MISLGSDGALALARACTVLFLVWLPKDAPAQPEAPPPPRSFFSDTSGVVPAEVAAQLEQRLRAFQAESSNQVLVVAADRIPEGYASLEEYTNRTAEAWRVGDKAKDNGLVLFVFVRDRKVRMEVGYGLEGALPDALASRIINDEIVPRFQEGAYGEGLVAGVDAIIRATKGEYRPAPARAPTGRNALILLIALLVLFFVLLPLLREVDDSRHSRTYSGRGWSGGGRRWGSRGGWGGFSRGGGSWGGGGGFSGGGGSFGGGGASGSW